MEQKTSWPRPHSDNSDFLPAVAEVVCPSCSCIIKIDTNLQSDELMEDALEHREYPSSLTKRETEVLQLILDGNTNKNIAKKIYRTERTVEYHRNRLMKKLGTHSTAELVKRAIQLGIAS